MTQRNDPGASGKRVKGVFNSCEFSQVAIPSLVGPTGPVLTIPLSISCFNPVSNSSNCNFGIEESVKQIRWLDWGSLGSSTSRRKCVGNYLSSETASIDQNIIHRIDIAFHQTLIDCIAHTWIHKNGSPYTSKTRPMLSASPWIRALFVVHRLMLFILSSRFLTRRKELAELRRKVSVSYGVHFERKVA